MIRSKRFVIQKYIERPLLVENKKFDIRLFILVDTDARLFHYREMYIRVSAYDFDLDDMQKFGHLNNIALQKYSNNFDGEKAVITTKMLEEHVRQHINPDFDFEQQIRPKLEHIICILGSCLAEKFTPIHPLKKNFELFGLDFMIDGENDVWFIEANTNPALSTGNSYLDQLIPRMLDDSWKLTLDRLFPPPKLDSELVKTLGQEEVAQIRQHYQSTKFPLLDHDDDLNLWIPVSSQDIQKALQTNPN